MHVPGVHGACMYKTDRFFWETVITGRKVSVVMLSVFRKMYIHMYTNIHISTVPVHVMCTCMFFFNSFWIRSSQVQPATIFQFQEL
jgi:hypothetical protein